MRLILAPTGRIRSSPVTKLHAHLVMGELIAAGRVDPAATVATYLPWIGSGYAAATVADVMDMNVANAFTEDYTDPHSGCYAEEEALGWRLPPDGRAEITMRDFAAAITGTDLTNRTGYTLYKSANTDVLTLIAAAVGKEHPLKRLEAITDAAGYEGGFHISLSPEGLPALSGGGCLSALDLARFGLLLARGGKAVSGADVGNAGFTEASRQRGPYPLSPDWPWMRYSNQLMTDGNWIGHAGYGGQFLMVDMSSGRVAAFLSVLDNDAGYDEAYMAYVIHSLATILAAPRGAMTTPLSRLARDLYRMAPRRQDTGTGRAAARWKAILSTKACDRPVTTGSTSLSPARPAMRFTGSQRFPSVPRPAAAAAAGH